MKFKQYLVEKMNQEKEVVLLVGLPASGKSTYIKKKLKEYEVVSNDHVVEEYAKKKNITYNESFTKLDRDTVKTEVKSRLKKAMVTGKVVIDNTNMTVKQRKVFLDEFDDSWEKTAIIFEVSDEELKKRLKGREDEIGKHIPPEVIKDMKSKYEEPTIEEFDEIWKA